MLKLYGFAVSNYFNMVRMALEASDIAYEIVHQYPNQDSEYLALSPMGKVPCLQTPEGTLAETMVILDYLNDAYPEAALFPSEPFAAARVRQMMHTLVLHIELPTRRLHPGVFHGGENEAGVIQEVEPVLRKGVRSVNALATLSPYLMGSEPTAADYIAMYTLDLAAMVAHKVYDWDLLADIEGGRDLLGRLGEQPAAQMIAKDRDEAMAAFRDMVRARRA